MVMLVCKGLKNYYAFDDKSMKQKAFIIKEFENKPSDNEKKEAIEKMNEFALLQNYSYILLYGLQYQFIDVKELYSRNCHTLMAVICDYANKGDETGKANELPIVEPRFTTCLSFEGDKQEQEEEEEEEENEEQESEESD